MAKLWFTDTPRAFAEAQINLLTMTIECALVMTSTTVLDDLDAVTEAGISNLDEFDGSGYARQNLGGKLLTYQASQTRWIFESDNPVFASIQPGSRDIAGVLLIEAAANRPLLFTDEIGFPMTVPAGTHDLEAIVPTDGWGFLDT